MALSVYRIKRRINSLEISDKPVEETAKVKQIILRENNAQVNSAKPVLVDWCGVVPTCKKMEPVLTQLKNEAFNKYKMVNIDAATQTEILKQMKVDPLPVFIVYKMERRFGENKLVVTIEELRATLAIIYFPSKN